MCDKAIDGRMCARYQPLRSRGPLFPLFRPWRCPISRPRWGRRSALPALLPRQRSGNIYCRGASWRRPGAATERYCRSAHWTPRSLPASRRRCGVCHVLHRASCRRGDGSIRVPWRSLRVTSAPEVRLPDAFSPALRGPSVPYPCARPASAGILEPKRSWPCRHTHTHQQN